MSIETFKYIDTGLSISSTLAVSDTFSETVKQKILEGRSANPEFKFLLEKLIDPAFKNEKNFLKELIHKILMQGTLNSIANDYVEWLQTHVDKVPRNEQFINQTIDLFIRDQQIYETNKESDIYQQFKDPLIKLPINTVKQEQAFNDEFEQNASVVTIRIWNSVDDVFEKPYVSIQTYGNDEFYAGNYPLEQPELSPLKSYINSSLKKDIRRLGNPIHMFNFYSLNVKAIKEEYKKFLLSKFDYSLFSSRSFRDSNSHSCQNWITILLDKAGIYNLIRPFEKATIGSASDITAILKFAKEKEKDYSKAAEVRVGQIKYITDSHMQYLFKDKNNVRNYSITIWSKATIAISLITFTVGISLLKQDEVKECVKTICHIQ